MEEKKGPLPALERYSSHEAVMLESRTMPVEMEDCRRRPLSSCILFLLLGVFVFTLGCFAVYTALSMGAVKKLGGEESPTARPLYMEQDNYPREPTIGRPKPNFLFELTVNGKKILGGGENKTRITIDNSEGPRQSDDFSSLRNFLKKVSGLQDSIRPNVLREESAEEKSKKPKIIIESWEFRKLPSDAPSGSPFSPFGGAFDPPMDSFEDILNTVFSPIRRYGSPIPPRKMDDDRSQMIIVPLSSGIFRNVPYSKKVGNVPSLKKDENEASPKTTEVKVDSPAIKKIENNTAIEQTSTPPPAPTTKRPRHSFPRTIFKDFQSILDNIFEEGSVSSPKKEKDEKVKTVTGNPTAEPRENVEVFKRMDKPYLDRYQMTRGIPRGAVSYTEGPLQVLDFPLLDSVGYDEVYPVNRNPYKAPKKYMPWPGQAQYQRQEETTTPWNPNPHATPTPRFAKTTPQVPFENTTPKK